jgi:hypothetical protein
MVVTVHTFLCYIRHFQRNILYLCYSRLLWIKKVVANLIVFAPSIVLVNIYIHQDTQIVKQLLVIPKHEPSYMLHR